MSNEHEESSARERARTDTKWWHECAIQHEVRFIRGRLKFGDAKNSAPFPSAVIVMRSGVGHNASHNRRGAVSASELMRLLYRTF